MLTNTRPLNISQVINDGLLGVIKLWVISTFLFFAICVFYNKMRSLKRKKKSFTCRKTFKVCILKLFYSCY